MSRWRPLPYLAVGLLVSAGCHLIIGSLNDCQANSDCTSRGPGLICEDQLCVLGLDPRCSIIGPDAGSPLTFGVLLPLTNTDGTPNQWGPYWLDAVELVTSELNPGKRTGIQNHPLRFLACDTQSSSVTAATLAADLIALGVPAIISDGSADTIAEAGVTVDAGVLILSGASTSPEITNLAADARAPTVRLVWRTTPSDAIQARVLASVLAGDGGMPPSVAVLYTDETYGQGLSGAFQASFSSVLPSMLFPFPQNSIPTEQVSEAAAQNPEVVVVIGYPADIVNVLNTAYANQQLTHVQWVFTQGAKFPALFGELTNPAMIAGAWGTAPGMPEPATTAWDWFAPEYKSEYVDPSTITDVGNVFDAAMLLALAADRALAAGQLSGTQMAVALTHMSTPGATPVPLDPPDFSLGTGQLEAGNDIDITGASGPLHFDPSTGEAAGPIEVWSIAPDGGFETEFTVEP